MLDRYALLICDEAFLPLVPEAEDQSMIALVAQHPNLVVIRSLTKLFGVAGLRVGYAIAQPDRLKRWQAWRILAGEWNGSVPTEQWLEVARYKRWQSRSAMDGEVAPGCSGNWRVCQASSRCHLQPILLIQGNCPVRCGSS